MDKMTEEEWEIFTTIYDSGITYEVIEEYPRKVLDIIRDKLYQLAPNP